MELMSKPHYKLHSGETGRELQKRVTEYIHKTAVSMTIAVGMLGDQTIGLVGRQPWRKQDARSIP